MIMRPIRLASHLVSKNSLSKPIHISHIPYIHERQHFARTMATARIIDITPENTGLIGITQSKAAAKKATEILQEDLELHHCFFNDEGFHNHIPHQILTLYGLGAPSEVLEREYRNNSSYQRPRAATHGKNGSAGTLQDWDVLRGRLGKGQYYADFLVFFQAEIERLGGWEATLKEYLFKGDERADDMLIRMFAGFLHPMIQLMYGVEWAQPAIVAMGLAQAAVHNDQGLKKFLFATDERARLSAAGSSAPMPSITSLLEAVRADEALAGSAHLTDSNKIRDGVFKRAYEPALDVTGRVRVAADQDEIDERTAEMYHATIYEGAAAALVMPDKEPKWDFFLIHHINVCPIILVLNAQDWVPLEAKARLLEWKIRMDLVQYAARKCPEIRLDRILAYEPKASTSPQDNDLLARVFALEEDGHASKLFRAIRVGQSAVERYESRDWVVIKGREAWDRVLRLAVDSVEAPGPHWVRGAGDRDAWKEIPDRKHGGGKL